MEINKKKKRQSAQIQRVHLLDPFNSLLNSWMLGCFDLFCSTMLRLFVVCVAIALNLLNGGLSEQPITQHAKTKNKVFTTKCLARFGMFQQPTATPTRTKRRENRQNPARKKHTHTHTQRNANFREFPLPTTHQLES